MRVVVLGAGFGGLELTTTLAEEFGDAIEIVLLDRSDSFVFGFSKLDVMFGRVPAEDVRHSYADIVKPGVRFVRTEVMAIDAQRRHVETTAGDFEADFLVVALGADLDPAATPGLTEAGHEFYTVAGAFALRDVLADFEGGRVVVAVTSTPFKCPPAPSETALMVDELLRTRGLREQSTVTLVMPLGKPIPPSPAASDAVLAAFAQRGIEWLPDRLVRELDGERGVAMLSDDTQLPFDLFLGVPQHRAPEVVTDAGLTVDGWIPVNPRTLETRYPGVYAVGDVTSVGTPKAGVFAEGQAAIAAEHIAAAIRHVETSAGYDGRGVCYLEFGGGEVATVDVTFTSGQSPVGTMTGPSIELAARKADFAASRVERWFGKARAAR